MAQVCTAQGAPAPGITSDTASIMTRPIPSTGERLPVVGLGTAYQWYADLPATHTALAEVVQALAAGGGSVIDTGSTYGAAEAMLGEILTETGLSPRLFTATKIEKLDQAAVLRGMQRLHVNKIDLLQLHNVEWPLQDLGPLREWKAQGLVRYIGVTTSANTYFDALETVMRRWKPDFIQFDCSLRNREAEQLLLPAAAEHGVATLINLPFDGHERAKGSLFRLVQGKPVPDWASEFDAATWGQFFLKYLLGNPAVTVVIPGTDKAEHMADNLGAARGRLPDAAQRQRMVRLIEDLG